MADYTDWAIFKVGDELYYFSDLRKVFLEIKLYHCANADSVLFKVVDMDFKQDLIIPEFNNGKTTFSKAGVEQYQQLEVFLKFKTYAETQKVQVKDDVLKVLMEMIRANKCGLGKTIKEEELIGAAKIEVLLRARLLEIEEAEKASAEGAKNLSNVSKANRPEANSKNSIQEDAFSVFIHSVEKQISNENFW